MSKETLVKFCGMTRREDVVFAADLGAAAVGFVLWPRSPRAVTPDQARDLVRALPPFTAAVGVFVDEPPERVREIVQFAGLTVAQLHGRETPDMLPVIGGRVIKALGEPDADLLADAARWPDAVTLLVDAVDPEQRGGTGREADWARAADLARTRRVVLAGGLRPENVAAAIARVAPFAVDVASGVEAGPGVKDHARMTAFIDAVRAASRMHHAITH